MQGYNGANLDGEPRDAQSLLNKMLSEWDRGRNLDCPKQTLYAEVE
jgi:hypothetical protein